MHKIIDKTRETLKLYVTSYRKMSRQDDTSLLTNGCVCSSGIFWDVPLITDIQRDHASKYAVLVLNRPLTQNQKFLTNFWENALVRMTVDGGTKQWDLFLRTLPVDTSKQLKLPNLITGDFDSITDEIMRKYKDQGCEVIHTPDQDYTDFTKAIIELQRYCDTTKTQVDHVLALGQSSGRLDQVLGNIQTLFLVKEKQLLDPKAKMYLISDDAISWLLTPGQHVIRIPKETIVHKRSWCSLVPIGQTCKHISTTGLKWNLNEATLQFGDLVSTSNTFDGSEEVTVKCSHTILWSMRIPILSNF